MGQLQLQLHQEELKTQRQTLPFPEVYHYFPAKGILHWLPLSMESLSGFLLGPFFSFLFAPFSHCFLSYLCTSHVVLRNYAENSALDLSLALQTLSGHL